MQSEPSTTLGWIGDLMNVSSVHLEWICHMHQSRDRGMATSLSIILLDNLDFVTPSALEESYKFYTQVIDILEQNKSVMYEVIGEPQLGKRGLYQDLNIKIDVEMIDFSRAFINICSMADGRDTLDMAEVLNLDFQTVIELTSILESHGLIKLYKSDIPKKK